MINVFDSSPLPVLVYICKHIAFHLSIIKIEKKNLTKSLPAFLVSAAFTFNLLDTVGEFNSRFATTLKDLLVPNSHTPRCKKFIPQAHNATTKLEIPLMLVQVNKTSLSHPSLSFHLTRRMFMG